MKRERDKTVIGAWLDCYNTLNETDFQVESYPDEEQRGTKSIDALCKDSRGKTLGLEHTRVEAFPGEMADNARFLEVMGQYEKDESVAEPGYQTSASIPVGAIPDGVHWETLGRDIGVFLNEAVRLGEGTHTFTQGRVSIPITISKLEVPNLPGSFLVERTWPGRSNEKSLAEKLPKLKESTADARFCCLSNEPWLVRFPWTWRTILISADALPGCQRLRVYKELTSMKKDQVDLPNAVVWIPDSKTPNGTAEVPLTPLSVEAFRRQMAIAGDSLFLFPSDRNRSGHQTTFKTVWSKTLRRAKVPYFRIYDLRSTYATRLSAGGVADEWVTQMLRQGDAQVFKKYSQMKLQMKREALEKLNRRASEMAPATGERMRTVMVQ